ncbi:malto-oligosyltrehalose trehalohydrolase [Mesorhizobium sp. CAU 1741]|uniref:malto-oligosyltrehalose trehalohydrolase n=1 Tax=Mesorhizobium sp. CAU 1741 TaxID=3140366 RepID=UPI00325B8FEC
MVETGDFTVFPKRWGAEFVRAGDVRFRIWAPDHTRLSLRLSGEDTPMSRDEDGWFELLASGVEAGAPYAFVLPDGLMVPDPASRAQEGDVHGPSLLVDPTAYRWTNANWRGRPWTEAVVYELHIGTFTEEGTFAAAIERLPHLAGLGVTAIELMPIGQFSGNRGWGYDGVLPYAPHNAYGHPDDLKRLVDTAHQLNLMVLLDVVYNHFGPDGNYLPAYASAFFDEARHTPWGAAIAYGKQPVRQFFIDNALYWLDEFNFDGLRLDAIDQIKDDRQPELLIELARAARETLPGRHIHLVTEDNRNVAYLHERSQGQASQYTAEWNDDFHNAAHCLLTGERDGYYEDFADDSLAKLARCMTEGFAYQGEPSPHADGNARGEPSAHLPTTAFIDFLQNHDQVGNRATGERLSLLVESRQLEVMTTILLLSPHIPMLFMGEEWDETRPFLFFTDYHGDLADAVRDGRRREFAKFPAFQAEDSREAIPDPNAMSTFASSKIDWSAMERSSGKVRLELIRALLETRRQHIVPLLEDGVASPGTVIEAQAGMLAVDWSLNNAVLRIRANLGDRPGRCAGARGSVIFSSGEIDLAAVPDELAPWHAVVALERS